MGVRENMGIVYVLKPGDHQAGATGDSINMGKYRHVAFIIQFATLTGDAVLTVKSGATAAVETTAETMHYRLADADQGADTADTYAAWADSAGLTLTAATYSDRTLIVEMDSNELTADQPWITLAFSAAADALNAAVVAVLCEPRYGAHDMPTAIA